MRIAALAILTLISAYGSIQAVTVHVPANQPTIQAGIDAAGLYRIRPASKMLT